VAEKKRTKGASPTAFFCSPSRESGEAHTDLLHDDFFTPHLQAPLYMDVQRRGINFYYIIYTIILFILFIQ